MSSILIQIDSSTCPFLCIQTRSASHQFRSIANRKGISMSSSATSQSRDHHHHAAHRSMAGLAPLGASCLWGGMYVVSKASFANIPPVTLGLLRLLIGSITLSILLWFANRRQSKPAAASLLPPARKRPPSL